MAAVLLISLVSPLHAQSNRSLNVITTGDWHIHSRIPLGTDALMLKPSDRVVEMLATAESPQFEGWTVNEQNGRPQLTDRDGRSVRALPQSVTFRVTVSTHDRLVSTEPMGIECTKDIGTFLLDLHFEVQIFRGMKMRELQPTRTWMIGVPAEEASEERIYRTTFNFDDVLPDDRVVLLIKDGSGRRLTKFHLEFL